MRRDPDVERWCAACRCNYPHEPLGADAWPTPSRGRSAGDGRAAGAVAAARLTAVAPPGRRVGAAAGSVRPSAAAGRGRLGVEGCVSGTVGSAGRALGAAAAVPSVEGVEPVDGVDTVGGGTVVARPSSSSSGRPASRSSGSGTPPARCRPGPPPCTASRSGPGCCRRPPSRRGPTVIARLPVGVAHPHRGGDLGGVARRTRRPCCPGWCRSCRRRGGRCRPRCRCRRSMTPWRAWVTRAASSAVEHLACGSAANSSMSVPSARSTRVITRGSMGAPWLAKVE